MEITGKAIHRQALMFRIAFVLTLVGIAMALLPRPSPRRAIMTSITLEPRRQQSPAQRSLWAALLTAITGEFTRLAAVYTTGLFTDDISSGTVMGLVPQHLHSRRSPLPSQAPTTTNMSTPQAPMLMMTMTTMKLPAHPQSPVPRTLWVASLMGITGTAMDLARPAWSPPLPQSPLALVLLVLRLRAQQPRLQPSLKVPLGLCDQWESLFSLSLLLLRTMFERLPIIACCMFLSPPRFVAKT